MNMMLMIMGFLFLCIPVVMWMMGFFEDSTSDPSAGGEKEKSPASSPEVTDPDPDPDSEDDDDDDDEDEDEDDE